MLLVFLVASVATQATGQATGLLLPLLQPKKRTLPDRQHPAGASCAVIWSRNRSDHSFTHCCCCCCLFDSRKRIGPRSAAVGSITTPRCVMSRRPCCASAQAAARVASMSARQSPPGSNCWRRRRVNSNSGWVGVKQHGGGAVGMPDHCKVQRSALCVVLR